jgi:competence protein ComFC
MFLTRTLNLLYDSTLALVYPQPCHVCGNSVETHAAGIACHQCWLSTRLFFGDEVLCWKCGVPGRGDNAAEYREQIRCHRCDEQVFSGARACGVYEKALRATVLCLKRQPLVPRCLSELLIAAAKRTPLNACTRIVPVPLHAARRRERGFNQAEVIGQVLSAALSLPMDSVSLIRSVHTERHRAGMDAKARRQTVEHAFIVQHAALIANETILLVDDVFTTGATASACAAALLGAGAKQVFVLTLARRDEY